jgi:hypothetical protein
MRPVLPRLSGLLPVLAACALLSVPARAAQPAPAPDLGRTEAFRRADANGVQVEDVFKRTRRMLHAWLAYADPRTLLLPDVLPGYERGPKGLHIYRPHNSGADNYPYLVATAWFTDRRSTRAASPRCSGTRSATRTRRTASPPS